MEIAPDFREFVACANARDVRYLIVGGYVVGFHGHPRYTKDLDVWIERAPENAGRLVGGSKTSAFPRWSLRKRFFEPDQIIQLGYSPLRIDLLTSVSGVNFADCYSRRETKEAKGTLLPFIGLEDLRINKRAAGSHQDLADLESLE